LITIVAAAAVAVAIIIVIIIIKLELSHLFTRSGLAHPEVSSVVFSGFFCRVVSTFLLSWLFCHEAFSLHVVATFFCTAVFYPSQSVLVLQSVQMYRAVFVTYLVSDAIILIASVAVMVQL
jgi:hypothetical protein